MIEYGDIQRKIHAQTFEIYTRRRQLGHSKLANPPETPVTKQKE